MKLSFFKYLALFCCFLVASASQAAEPLRFEGDYVFSWSGLRIGKLHLALDQNEKDYHIESQVKTSGIVALFSDHKSHTRVKGIAQGDGFQPIEYQSNYNSGNTDKVIALKYDAEGKLLDEVVEPYRGARPEVPNDLKTRTADSLTAIVAMRQAIKQALNQGKTEVSVPVFDGIRRFDLLARVIDPYTSLTLEGKTLPAVKLGLKRVPLGGFKDKELKKMAEGEPELEFFLEREHYTLLGFQLPLYGSTVGAWVKNACVNASCHQAQMASKR